MPEKIVIALISLGGVMLSIIVSWLVSRYKVKAEIRKLRLEMQHIYATQLHQARLNVFPELYRLIETHVKEIQKQKLVYKTFTKYFIEIDDWHTNNGYLLTAATNSTIYSYLRKIRNITARSEEAFNQRIADSKKRRELIRNAWEIELGIKNDLGIFEVEFFDPERKFRTYKEIDNLLDQSDG